MDRIIVETESQPRPTAAALTHEGNIDPNQMVLTTGPDMRIRPVGWLI